MTTRTLLAAGTDWRTLSLLGGGILLAVFLGNPFPAIIGLGAYLWAVNRLANSPAYTQAAERAAMIHGLMQRYRALDAAVRELGNRFSKDTAPGQGRSWYDRAAGVVKAARSIYQEWHTRRAASMEISHQVDQALQLAVLYLRLLFAYQELFYGRRGMDARSLRDRLERNQRKLEATSDPEARESLEQAIEMDQRVLAQAQTDSVERERYQAKLVAIESTLEMLRRQVCDPEAVGDGQSLDDLLVEAAAMDQALDEVHQVTRARAR